MEFDEFSRASGFVAAEELEKAQLIGYFLLRERGVREFNISGLRAEWLLVNVPSPNGSRLEDKLSKSRNFPKGTEQGKFRLHADVIDRLNSKFAHLWPIRTNIPRRGVGAFVHVDRIEELRSLVGTKPDPLRLVRLCEELNTSYDTNCFMAVALLGRTIINHVPPALGCKNFSEVASNYGGDPKTNRSFKKIAQKLEEVARVVGDLIAHEMMRTVESLPSPVTVDFSQELDVLLTEVARVLREKNRLVADVSVQGEA